MTRTRFVFFAAVTSAAAVINAVSYFFLPNTVATGIRFDGTPAERMSTPLFLIIGFALVAVPAAMHAFSGRQDRKFFILSLVLLAGDAAAVIINLIL